MLQKPTHQGMDSLVVIRYGATFGEHHAQPVADVPLSALETERLAMKGASKAVPQELPLSVTRKTAQGHVGLWFHLECRR